MSGSDFPGFANLFEFGRPGLTREFTAEIDLGDVDPRVLLRGDAHSTGAVARWEMGRAQPGAIVWTTGFSILFSPELVAALRKVGATGWASYPVELIGKRDEPLGVYYGLIVHGRCGAIDKSRSVRVMKQFPAGREPVLRGLFFDEASWDGSDFFMPRDHTAWKMVTRRARDVIARHARDASFETLYEVETMLPDG